MSYCNECSCLLDSCKIIYYDQRNELEFCSEICGAVYYCRHFLYPNSKTQEQIDKEKEEGSE